jgi:hypothetical protein
VIALGWSIDSEGEQRFDEHDAPRSPLGCYWALLILVASGCRMRTSLSLPADVSAAAAPFPGDEATHAPRPWPAVASGKGASVNAITSRSR